MNKILIIFHGLLDYKCMYLRFVHTKDCTLRYPVPFGLLKCLRVSWIIVWNHVHVRGVNTNLLEHTFIYLHCISLHILHICLQLLISSHLVTKFLTLTGSSSSFTILFCSAHRILVLIIRFNEILFSYSLP